MPKYIAVTALSLPVDPSNPNSRNLLHRAGSVVELDEETGKRCLEAKVVRPLDEPQAAAEESNTPPARPSANASTATWREYAEAIGITGIPDNAKREDIVAAVDQFENRS